MCFVYMCVLIRLYLPVLSSSRTSRTCWCPLPLFHQSLRRQRKKAGYTFCPFFQYLRCFLSVLIVPSSSFPSLCVSQWWRRKWMRRWRRRRGGRSMYAPTYHHGNGPWRATRSWQPPWRPACQDPSRFTQSCLCTKASTGTLWLNLSIVFSINCSA